MVIAAGIATSCGGRTSTNGSPEDGSGDTAAGGSGASDGTDTSGGLAASGGRAISLETGGGDGIEAIRCSDPFNDADTVTLIYVPEEPPTGSGGTPVEGRYHLTQWELFTGADGPDSGEVWTQQERIILTWMADGNAELDGMRGQTDYELGYGYQWNETLTFDGSSFSSTPTCRTQVVSVYDSTGLYTASDDQLVLIRESSAGDGTFVYTYTLAPESA
jgi:hypothetical protein